MPADLGKGEWMKRTIDDVGSEEAAEEHDLGHQKDPHPERRGIALLFEVVLLLVAGRDFSWSNLGWSLLFGASGLAAHELTGPGRGIGLMQAGVVHRAQA